MSHESVVSYYTNNFHALFQKDLGFRNNFTLSDLESMLPYEREIYLTMMHQKIEEHNKNKQKGV